MFEFNLSIIPCLIASCSSPDSHTRSPMADCQIDPGDGSDHHCRPVSSSVGQIRPGTSLRLYRFYRRRQLLFQRLRDFPGFSMPQSGKRQNAGRHLLFAAPASFRDVRGLTKIDRRCAFAAVLPIVQVSSIHIAGRRQDGGHDF